MGGLNWYSPWMISVSGKFTPQAFTLMTTWPLPGLSGSISSITRLSGDPYALHNTAFNLCILLGKITGFSIAYHINFFGDTVGDPLLERLCGSAAIQVIC